MKIAVLAAGGKSGSLITKEALGHGFNVSAFVRNANKDLESSGAKVIQKDIFALQNSDLEGFDIIIDAFGEWQDLSLHKKHIEHLHKILVGNQARLIVVGGAGSLYVDKEHKTRLMDTPTFPAEYMGVAKATAEVLDFLRDKKDINWTYVCPPAEFIPDAPKSNNYKIIGEEFTLNSKGESKASYATYALALIDIIKDSSLNHKRVGVIEE